MRACVRMRVFVACFHGFVWRMQSILQQLINYLQIFILYIIADN